MSNAHSTASIVVQLSFFDELTGHPIAAPVRARVRRFRRSVALSLVQLDLDFTRAPETPPRRHLPLVLEPWTMSSDERIALMKNRLEYGRELDALDACRPKTRADCADVPRPCPFVSCRWNLYLDVDERGVITIPRPDVVPDERAESCALDLIEREPDGLETTQVAAVMGLSREQVARIEERGKEAVARDRDLSDAHERKEPARPATAPGRRRHEARPSPTTGNVRHRLSAALREKAILDVLAEGPKTTSEIVSAFVSSSAPIGMWWTRHVLRILRSRELIVARSIRVAGQDSPVPEWMLRGVDAP